MAGPSFKSPDDDVFVGRYVLENNVVSREAVLESLFQIAQERRSGARPGYSRPLGVVLIARGLLTEEDLNAILAARVSPSSAHRLNEAEVGKLLVAGGIMVQEDVDRCVAMQKETRAAGRTPPRLGELVVKRGYVTEQQVMRVLAYQNRALFACVGCGARVTATPPPAGTRYRCKKCGALVAPVEPAKESGPSAPAMREGERGTDAQDEIDIALGSYLRQKRIVRRDQIRECQHLQTEFARYGLVVPLLELLRRVGAVTWNQQHELQQIDFSKLVQGPDWKSQAVPGYRLISRVASGAFASLHIAESLFSKERVAVKVLHTDRATDPKTVQRFDQEGVLLRKFASPHIVRCVDGGSHRGTHYLVMDYLEGRSLAQALSDSGVFPLRAALSATRQIAEALRYLHSEGYLHRDVKPDNAIIDESGKVILCDLGFAMALPETATGGSRAPTVVGTAGYRAPEAVRGEADVKVGSDIYSLGILFFALLTGHEPFAGGSSEECVTDRMAQGAPIPNLMMVQAPVDVIQVVKKMLHSDRAKRYATVVEVIKALDAIKTE